MNAAAPTAETTRPVASNAKFGATAERVLPTTVASSATTSRVLRFHRPVTVATIGALIAYASANTVESCPATARLTPSSALIAGSRLVIRYAVVPMVKVPAASR